MNGKGDNYRVKWSREFELNYERIFNAKKNEVKKEANKKKEKETSN